MTLFQRTRGVHYRIGGQFMLMNLGIVPPVRVWPWVVWVLQVWITIILLSILRPWESGEIPLHTDGGDMGGDGFTGYTEGDHGDSWTTGESSSSSSTLTSTLASSTPDPLERKVFDIAGQQDEDRRHAQRERDRLRDRMDEFDRQQREERRQRLKERREEAARRRKAQEDARKAEEEARRKAEDQPTLNRLEDETECAQRIFSRIIRT